MLTNTTGVSLSLAAWLAHDSYDHDPREKSISATSLIQSVRKTILKMRYPELSDNYDISTRLASKMGTALHDSIENVWVSGAYRDALQQLGHPSKIIDKIVVNPTPEDLLKDVIPIYLEQRGERKLNGWYVTGKFDFIAEGTLEDFKSTTTYAYIKRSNDHQYRLQGSIYKWLFPDIIQKEYMNIQYIFKNYSPAQLRTRGYPQSNPLAYKVPLMTIEETNSYISKRLRDIDNAMLSPDDELPLCTAQDLRIEPSVWKYYKNPSKTIRSTANFTTQAEAYSRRAMDGNVGIVKEFKGSPKACTWCPVTSKCNQAQVYIADGILKM